MGLPWVHHLLQSWPGSTWSTSGSRHKLSAHWFRYFDDTFMVWPHVRDKLEKFWEYLNSIHPNVLFMMEMEEENHYHFLICW
jgi:hypothetical protein